ncbi:hypothetical protein CF326_g4162 [Tilletia indica]|nr:hypothetical protein CF326_g4162 [Tilletia indica]
MTANYPSLWRLFAGLRSCCAIGSCPIRFRSFFSTESSNASPPASRPAISHDALYHGPKKGDKVIVGVSGGVDSSVSALLLAQQDFDLEAVFMRNWATEDQEGPSTVLSSPDSSPSLPFDQSTCTWREDYESAQAVCRHLSNLPLRLLDFQKEYWNAVFDPALSAWGAGETPNPDVACNRYIKFGALMDRILAQPGPSEQTVWLATGHYGRLRLNPVLSPDGKRSVQLLRAVDPVKDQSYYLSSVPASRLEQAHFPIGHLLKSEVRDIARRFDLPTANRKESMGLCFVGEHKPRAGPSSEGAPEKRGMQGNPGPFANFLDSYLDSSSGPLVSPSGEILGQHSGLHTLTIGQSARIPGKRERWYVAKKPRKGQVRPESVAISGGGVGSAPISQQDPLEDDNAVLVVPGKDHPLLQCRRALVHDFHWIAGHPPLEACSTTAIRAWTQVRHRQKAVRCLVEIESGDRQSMNTDQIHVVFPESVCAVAPGQVLALWADTATPGQADVGARPEDDVAQNEANTVCLGSGTIADVWTMGEVG